jgi:hypothetical protein
MTETEETMLAVGLGLVVLYLYVTPNAGPVTGGGGAIGLPAAPGPIASLPPSTSIGFNFQYGASQAGLVAQALDEQSAAGNDMTDLCVISAAVDRAVELIRDSTGWPAGRLSKPDGTQCGGLAVDIVAFPNGEIYDVVIGKGSINGAAWDRDDPVDPSRYVG